MIEVSYYNERFLLGSFGTILRREHPEECRDWVYGSQVPTKPLSGDLDAKLETNLCLFSPC